MRETGPMSFSTLIKRDHRAIIDGCTSFAKTVVPLGSTMTAGAPEKDNRL